MDHLLFAVQGNVATITLNRPQQRNAINYEMWCGLAELCSQIEANDNIRVVLVEGAGEEAFSAGGDVSEFAAQRNDPWQAKIYNGKVERALKSLLHLGKPTVALIKGYCLGGGCMLAAHCDIRIAAENAVFGMPVAKLGTLVDYGELQRFIHLLGVGVTLDLLLTARLIQAPEAKHIGLCSQLFPLEEFGTATEQLAQRMARLAPLTQRWHKQMVHTLLNKPDLLDLDTEEAMLPDACYDTEDYAEGIRAFLQKRPPNFRGR